MRSGRTEDYQEGSTLAVVLCAIVLTVIVAIILPSLARSRGVSCQNACINNLRQIDSGKEQAMLVEKWTNGVDCDLPANKAIVNSYIKGNTTPECPGEYRSSWHSVLSGRGVYSYNTIGRSPTCSFSGRTTHRLRDW